MQPTTEEKTKTEIPVDFEIDDLGIITKYICPHCKSESVEKVHKDDAKTQWFKCWDCEEFSVRLLPIKEPCLSCEYCFTDQCYKLKDKILTSKEVLEIYEKDNWRTCANLQTIPTPKKKPKILEHINEIENPKFTGLPVIFEGVVSSTTDSYTIPSKIESFRIEKSEDKKEILTPIRYTIEKKDSANIALTSINILQQQRFLQNLMNTKKHIKELEYRTVYSLKITPPVYTLEMKGDKFCDEKGYEYKSLEIFISTDKRIRLAAGSVVQFEGIVSPNPKTQKTTVLVYRISLPEDTKNYDIEKIKKLKEYLEGKTVLEKACWTFENFAIFSQLVNRMNIIKATFLAYFTPLVITFNGGTNRGFCNILIIGDTTCGKSHSQKEGIRLFKNGFMMTAETATTVGLIATVSQTKGNDWHVEFGMLPLLDQKLLIIDGAQKLGKSNWATLAETERTGIVIIVKASKTKTYARVRQIKIANPVDLEDDKYATKNIDDFVYPIQAVPTFLDKTSIARLDFVVCVNQNDVQPEEINIKNTTKYDEKLLYYSEVLKWCWSNTAKIEFTEDAENYLLECATRLTKEYNCDQIPLLTHNTKWKLARLSASVAFFTLSTEDYATVTVTKEHVDFVIKFLEEEYTTTGLKTYAQETRFEVLEIEDVKQLYDLIVTKTEGKIWYNIISQIFKFIVLKGHVTKDDIKTRFNLAENNESRPLFSVLTTEKLLNRKRGFYPTSKLNQAYKISELPEFKSFLEEKTGEKPTEPQRRL